MAVSFVHDQLRGRGNFLTLTLNYGTKLMSNQKKIHIHEVLVYIVS